MLKLPSGRACHLGWRRVPSPPSSLRCTILHAECEGATSWDNRTPSVLQATHQHRVDAVTHYRRTIPPAASMLGRRRRSTAGIFFVAEKTISPPKQPDSGSRLRALALSRKKPLYGLDESIMFLTLGCVEWRTVEPQLTVHSRILFYEHPRACIAASRLAHFDFEPPGVQY